MHLNTYIIDETINPKEKTNMLSMIIHQIPLRSLGKPRPAQRAPGTSRGRRQSETGTVWVGEQGPVTGGIKQVLNSQELPLERH